MDRIGSPATHVGIVTAIDDPVVQPQQGKVELGHDEVLVVSRVADDRLVNTWLAVFIQESRPKVVRQGFQFLERDAAGATFQQPPQPQEVAGAVARQRYRSELRIREERDAHLCRPFRVAHGAHQLATEFAGQRLVAVQAVELQRTHPEILHAFLDAHPVEWGDIAGCNDRQSGVPVGSGCYVVVDKLAEIRENGRNRRVLRMR